MPPPEISGNAKVRNQRATRADRHPGEEFTLQVLLAALRDTARGLPGSLAEKLEKSHLVNQFEEGLDHFKLLPTQTNGDRKAFLALIKGEPVADSESRVEKSCTWFQGKLKSRGSMQLRLRDELSEFVRHFLMRQGGIVKKGEIYRTLKERTDEQTPDGIAAFLDELHRSAVHYHRLLDSAQELNPDLQPRLRRLRRLVGLTQAADPMNVLCIVCALTVCPVPPAFCAEESLEEFYVRMELEYAAATTTRSEEHPEVKALAAALKVLREKAQLSDRALRKVVEDEADCDRVQTGGDSE